MKKKDSASLMTTSSAPIIRYRESIAYDENDEIVSDVLYRSRYEDGFAGNIKINQTNYNVVP